MRLLLALLGLLLPAVAWAAPPSTINGVCGASNGQYFTSAPTTGLCSAGTPTTVVGSGPWQWQCIGSGKKAKSSQCVAYTPPTPPPPGVPAGAAAAGFTTLAANYDFSQPPAAGWLGCYPDDSLPHQWYQGIWWSGQYEVPCPGRFNFVQDGGQQVLDLTWNSTDTATFGANVLETTNHSYPGTTPQYTAFPNGYYEVTFRVQTTPDIVGIGGTWWNAWLWNEQAMIYSQTNYPKVMPLIEHDIMEDHGEFPTYLSSGCINWGAGGPGYGCGYSYVSFRSGYDFRQYHTYGYRITSDGTSKQEACGYLDNVFQGCTPTNATGVEFNQRNFLILSVGWGCNYHNGWGNCQNRPIQKVYQCPGNNQVCITIPGDGVNYNGLTYPTNHPLAYISGVDGVPGANGVWNVTSLQTYPAGTTDWVLEGSTFSGAWIAGTGTFNPYQAIDMYVKNFKVWSCADWNTTMCNGAVLSGAP